MFVAVVVLAKTAFISSTYAKSTQSSKVLPRVEVDVNIGTAAGDERVAFGIVDLLRHCRIRAGIFQSAGPPVVSVAKSDAARAVQLILVSSFRREFKKLNSCGVQR